MSVVGFGVVQGGTGWFVDVGGGVAAAVGPD